MIFILPFIQICLSSVIDVNLGTYNIWQSNQLGKFNYTYKISQSNSPYISVQITLSAANSNFILVSKQGSPVVDFNGPFTQGSTIDTISVQENRLTRFLKISATKFPIFISTFDETTKSSYQIIISSSNVPVCDNGCSQQGSCQESGCQCNSGYIGNDCHQIAKELLITDESQQIILISTMFFYIDLTKIVDSSLKLKFTTDSESSVTVYLQKSAALSLPDQNTQTVNTRIVDQFIVDSTIPTTISFDIPENLESYNKLVFAAGINGGNTATFYNTLTIDFNPSSGDDSSTTTIIVVAVVVPIVGLIIIAISAFLIFKHIKEKRERENRQSQYQNQNPPGETNLIPQPTDQTTLQPPVQPNAQPYVQPNAQSYAQPYVQQIYQGPTEETFNAPVTQAFVEIYTQQGMVIENIQINPTITCSVCNKHLSNGLQLSKTNCGHTFHKSCILSYVQSYLECPLCRNGLVVKYKSQGQQRA